MALVGELQIENKTNKILAIYQGPKYRRYRGWVGPKSWAGYEVNDPHGNTYFELRPTPDSGGGKSYFKTIGTPAKTRVKWKIE